MDEETTSDGSDIMASGLAAVIPAFNEARSIQTVVKQVNQRALTIVVDDGSTDDTAALARAAGAHVVTHTLNRGYDAALETGLRAALGLGCTFAVTMDADGQHEPAVLDRFLAEFEAGADLVIGHRDRIQRWSEALFCFVGRVVWGIHDPLCGMKGYRLAILTKIANLNTYDSIGTELAVRLIKSGLRAKQPKIRTRSRNGTSRFGGGLKANYKICKALWMGLTQRTTAGNL